MRGSSNFIAECQAAVRELATASELPRWHSNSGDDDDIVRVVSWQDADICHAVELCWAMFTTTPAFNVCWHGKAGLCVCHVPGRRRLPRKRVTQALLQFAMFLPHAIASLRRHWWVADAAQVVDWPFSAQTPTLVLPAMLGRERVRKCIETHTLLLRQGDRTSQQDVFWRRLVRWRNGESKDTWHFGRVQHNVFYALVPRAELREFMHVTGIVL